MCPIVGARYNLQGHNYDVCQNEFDKLSPDEQAKFVKIEAPVYRPTGPCAGGPYGPWRPRCWRGGMGGRLRLVSSGSPTGSSLASG